MDAPFTRLSDKLSLLKAAYVHLQLFESCIAVDSSCTCWQVLHQFGASGICVLTHEFGQTFTEADIRLQCRNAASLVNWFAAMNWSPWLRANRSTLALRVAMVWFEEGK